MTPRVTGSEDAESQPATRRRHRFLSLLAMPFRPLFAVGRFFAPRPVLLTAVVGLVAAGFTFGTLESLAWMETEDFCGRCHTMNPEVAAHEHSTHADVECAECHVGAGLKGLAKAKIGGMRQMAKLLMGTYARPIPPAAHGMPPASETCGRCHDPARQREDLLVTRSHFAADEKNTEQRVALVVRLAPNDPKESLGIHWHVLSKVEYIPKDPEGEHAQAIDWVGVEKPDGSYVQYISKEAIEISEQAGEFADGLRRVAEPRTMGCYDCHNRLGHEFPSPERALNEAISTGRVARSIPYIKARGLAAVTRRYASREEADDAIRHLAKVYHTEYPNVFLEDARGLRRSLISLGSIYRETSHPEMSVVPDEYPNQLGHTDSAGCFRCHDGGHYKIVNGRLGTETIPSTCSTCHSFPSVGDNLSTLPLGTPPLGHEEPLYVFEHKTATGVTDPTKSACGACHSQNYCTNCHSSGAKGVKHDDMLFDHAAIVRTAGEQACGYCHQKPSCARCHDDAKYR